MIKKQWVEKHRPKSINDVIFSTPRLKKILQSYVDSKQMPNILLYGGPGTGKTSTAGAIIKDIGVNKLDVLKINCSDEKIEAVREKIKIFATTMPYGDFKVVRLEEFDYMGHEAQALLRSLMEEVSSSCRFIATCNYINKVLPALRSRFTQELHITNPHLDDVLVRAAEVLEKEGIEYSIEALENIVAVAYPDMRKIIQLLEACSTTGTLNIQDETAQAADWKLELLPLLEQGDLHAARKVVCTSASKEEIQDLFRFLYDNLAKIKGLETRELQDEALILISTYQYQHAFAADAEINIAALFAELINLTR